MKGVRKLITVAVVMPAYTAKIGARSLYETESYYREQGNDFAADICLAAIECNARAFKITHKVKEGPKGRPDFRRIHFVRMQLDFENPKDGGKFIGKYSQIVSA